MKLLFYSPVFAPRIGGIETIVYTISTGLAELKGADGKPEFEITFVTQTPAGEFDDATLPFRMVRNPSVGELRKLIGSADVLHIAQSALVPLFLGYLSGKPTVVEHHGFQHICPAGHLLQEPAEKPCPGHFLAGRYGECLRCCRTNSNWRTAFKKLITTWARRFLAPRIFANIMPTENLGTLVQLPNAVTIHHGIPLPDKRDVQSRSRSTCSPIRLLYQGRLVSTKGIGTLIEAAALLHKQKLRFELVVIGDGPERKALEMRTRQLGIGEFVQFAGYVSDAEMAAIVGEAGIVIVPSLAGEVFGLVVAENMARGIALVTSDVGAFVEVLGSAGKTFAVGDSRELADRLKELLENPQLICELGRQAQERAFECFGISKMVSEHAAVYRRALAAER